jgi:hypothetical protein
MVDLRLTIVPPLVRTYDSSRTLGLIAVDRHPSLGGKGSLGAEVPSLVWTDRGGGRGSPALLRRPIRSRRRTHDEADRLKSELVELAVRIRRQVSHLEALEADTDAGAEIRSRLRELTAQKARRERELEAAERALAAKRNREQAQELVDLLPQLDGDGRSPRGRVVPGDARCSGLPGPLRARSERVEGTGDARSGVPVREWGRQVVPLSVPPTGQESKRYPQVKGISVALSKRHAKIRRDGYRHRTS